MEGGAAGKFGRDDSEAFLQLRQVPAFATENADLRIRLDDGVALAGDGLDEGRFAAAVGAEDRDVLAGANSEVDVVEHDIVATGHIDMLKFQKGGHPRYMPLRM